MLFPPTKKGLSLFLEYIDFGDGDSRFLRSARITVRLLIQIPEYWPLEYSLQKVHVQLIGRERDYELCLIPTVHLQRRSLLIKSRMVALSRMLGIIVHPRGRG
jgi:hypothetical protein